MTRKPLSEDGSGRMKQIPEKNDIEEVSRDCDRVVAYMRDRHTDDETLNAIGRICVFVYRYKQSLEWVENVIRAIKEMESNENIRQEIRKSSE